MWIISFQEYILSRLLFSCRIPHVEPFYQASKHKWLVGDKVEVVQEQTSCLRLRRDGTGRTLISGVNVFSDVDVSDVHVSGFEQPKDEFAILWQIGQRVNGQRAHDWSKIERFFLVRGLKDLVTYPAHHNYDALNFDWSFWGSGRQEAQQGESVRCVSYFLR
jgi:hypothetical protein